MLPFGVLGQGISAVAGPEGAATVWAVGYRNATAADGSLIGQNLALRGTG